MKNTIRQTTLGIFFLFCMPPYADAQDSLEALLQQAGNSGKDFASSRAASSADPIRRKREFEEYESKRKLQEEFDREWAELPTIQRLNNRNGHLILGPR